jgi:hypothetical protein
LVFPAFLLAACGGDDSSSTVPASFDPSKPYAPDVTPAALTPEITHELMPTPVGATWTYESVTPDGTERIEIVVEAETKDIAAGAVAREVRDTAFFEDVMIEDTRDWFGQDADGNVWYLGEDTAEYEAGVVTSTEGSWEWGVNDALPGVVMLAAPHVGDSYRQEYLVAEAQDYATIVSLDETVTVPAGTFEHCLKTHDQSALDPTLDELKYYCPGVGQVLTEEGEVREELIAYTGL